MACNRSAALSVAWALALAALIGTPAAAQTLVKIGLISSYTGFVAQAGDQEMALGKGSAARQRFVIQRHQIAVATKRPGDQVGRVDIILGNDNAMPEEGVGSGGNHGKTLGPERSGSGRSGGRPSANIPWLLSAEGTRW